jgi:hypothetical protein
MFSKRRAEILNSPFQGRVIMFKSFCKNLIVLIEKITVLTLVLSMLGVGSAFAAAGGIPGPPIFIPPPPPCISTGILQEDDASVGCYFCNVRNVGTTSHKVSVDVRDTGNVTQSGTVPLPLAPGHGIVVSACPQNRNFTASNACIVTTDEGTTDALRDLAVVFQFSSPAAETEGKIFNSCALSSGVAGSPP